MSQKASISVFSSMFSLTVKSNTLPSGPCRERRSRGWSRNKACSLPPQTTAESTEELGKPLTRSELALLPPLRNSAALRVLSRSGLADLHIEVDLFHSVFRRHIADRRRVLSRAPACAFSPSVILLHQSARSTHSLRICDQCA